MKNILIVKLGALGDVINTIPLAVQLKMHFGARIHWLVAPLSYPIVSRHPAVDRAILFDRNRSVASAADVIKELRSQPYEVVLDLQRILKSAFFSMLAPCQRRIGFDRRRCKEMTWLLPYERITPADPQAHMLDQYLEFAAHLGVQVREVQWQIPVCGRPSMTLPDEFVVLNIGATKPANRWTTEGFAALARSLWDQCQISSVLTGGKEDAAMGDRIESSAQGAVHNLVGRTNIRELVDVIEASKAMVTCDTGPMHLAVALGRKVVALFGPSDHKRTGPYRGKVIRKKTACAPCNKKTCENPACMTAIDAQDVLRVLVPYIKGL